MISPWKRANIQRSFDSELKPYAILEFMIDKYRGGTMGHPS